MQVPTFYALVRQNFLQNPKNEQILSITMHFMHVPPFHALSDKIPCKNPRNQADSVNYKAFYASTNVLCICETKFPAKTPERPDSVNYNAFYACTTFSCIVRQDFLQKQHNPHKTQANHVKHSVSTRIHQFHLRSEQVAQQNSDEPEFVLKHHLNLY